MTRARAKMNCSLEIKSIYFKRKTKSVATLSKKEQLKHSN